MSENRNCPNCGAPYDIELNKCPYCGTSYFDLNCLQISGEPFYLKIRTVDGRILTQKCMLNSVNVTIEPSCTYVTDMTTTLELQNIAENGRLSTYYKEAI